MTPTVDRLLSPTPYQDFVANYWGQECLLGQGQAARFEDLFRWSSIEQILSTQRFDFPRLQLVRRGKVVPSSEYMTLRHDRRGNPFVSHVSRAVVREMQRGAMLHIAAIQDTSESLANFTAALELELNADVQVNLHAALARSKGFSTHWDGHDVFVIQVAGKKAWRLFGFTDAAPLAVPPDQKGIPPQRLVRELVLEAGDMLYVPRGYWHAAEALDDISLHLTFAAQYPTGLDFLSWAVARLASEPIARQDIPFCRFAASDNPLLQQTRYVADIAATLSARLQPATVQEFLEEYRLNLGHTNTTTLEGGFDAKSGTGPETHRRARS